MTITLYEYGPTRSARVKWLLSELGIDYTSRCDKSLIGSLEVRALNHTGKLPTIIDNGKSMFESSAICTYLADKYPEKGLIPAAGTWPRGKHEQWVSFILTEVEAHLWSTARNTHLYPEAKRVPEIVEQNNREVEKSLQVLDGNLCHNDYVLGSEFMVTDIIVGYTTIWAQKMGLTMYAPQVEAYNQRLLERPDCPLVLDQAKIYT